MNNKHWKADPVTKSIMELQSNHWWGYGSQAIDRAPHRAAYTYADARAIADWLNQRAGGYP